MKTKEELNELKSEFESLTTKIHELSEEELSTISAGNSDIADFFEKIREGIPSYTKPVLK